MALLSDKHRILITIDHTIIKNIETSKNEIICFFENLISSNRYIFSPTLVYQYFYNLKKNFCYDQIKTLQTSISNIISANIKQTRNNFRKLHRSRQLKISYIINYIKTFQKTLKTVDSIINVNSKDNVQKWGASDIVKKAIYNIYNTLLVDNVILEVLSIAIQEYENIYQFIKYIKIMSWYDCSYSIFVDKIEESVQKKIGDIMDNTKYLHLSKISSKSKIIFKFRDYYELYKKLKSQYNYVLNDKNFNINLDFKSCILILYDYIYEIINNLEILELIDFINIYHSEIKYISKIAESNNLKNIDDLFFDKLNYMNNFEDLINYGNTLHNLINDKIHIKLLTISVNVCNSKKLLIEENIEKNIIWACKKISNNILNNNFNKSVFIYLFFHTYISTYNSIKCMDLFCKMLEKELIFRIIYHNTKLPIEMINYHCMVNNFSENKFYNYRMILNDFKNSNVNTLTITPEIWGINTLAGSIGLDILKNIKESESIKSSFMELIFYELVKDNSSKKYFVHPHLGIVDINFNSELQVTKIILLPIQMLFLEAFENNDIVTDNNFKKLISSYKNVEQITDNIVKVFLEFDIIHKKSFGYVINKKYNGKSEINLIHRYNELCNTEVVVNEMILKELAYDREMIISSLINSILKTSNDNDYRTLYNKCKDSISLFNLSDKIFQKSIDDMIIKEYIKSDKNNYIKLLY
jgi:hypothetical protein